MSTNYNKFVEKNIRTAWVKTWTVEFLKGLDNLEAKTTIEEYCRKKLQEFSDTCKQKAEERAKEERNTINEHSWKQSSTSYMSGIRKAIKAWSESSKYTQISRNFHVPSQARQGSSLTSWVSLRQSKPWICLILSSYKWTNQRYSNQY